MLSGSLAQAREPFPSAEAGIPFSTSPVSQVGLRFAESLQVTHLDHPASTSQMLLLPVYTSGNCGRQALCELTYVFNFIIIYFFLERSGERVSGNSRVVFVLVFIF